MSAKTAQNLDGTRAGSSRLLPVMLVVAGLAAGAGGAAATVMMVRAGGNDHAPAPEAPVEEVGPVTASQAPAPFTYTVPDLVVNPAGSAGTRFLVAAVAVGLPDEKALKAVTAREPEVRDAILGVLGSMTVDQLIRAQADGDARDSLRAALRQPLVDLFSEGQVGRVLLPRLVVQ